MSTREWLPIVQHDDWQTGRWDQREDEELLQEGHLQWGSKGSQCQKADPRWNMPPLVEFFCFTCDDWLRRRQSFFSFRYLKSDPILGYCLPLTMHTEDKTEKVRISLNAKTAVPSYFNFTECNQAENQHWGQRGCGNHNSACAQGLKVFLILSIIARSGTLVDLWIARSEHFNSKCWSVMMI